VLVTDGVAVLDTLTFRDGAELAITGGAVFLETREGLDADRNGAGILVDGGAFAFNGHIGRDMLAIQVNDGTLSNGGYATGAMDIRVSGGGFLMGDGGDLFRLNRASRLTIDGSDAKIGFDGATSLNVLNMSGGELTFIFDEGGVSAIEEFDSAWDGDGLADTKTETRFNSGSIVLDLSQVDAASVAGRHVLIDTDRLSAGLQDLDLRVVGAGDGTTVRLGQDFENSLIYVDVNSPIYVDVM